MCIRDSSCLNKKYPDEQSWRCRRRLRMQPVFQRASKRLIYVYRGMRYGGKQYVFAILVYDIGIYSKPHFLFFLSRMHYGNCLSQIFTQQLHQTCFIKLKKGVWEHLINLTLGIIKQISNSRTANQLILELDLRIS